MSLRGDLPLLSVDLNKVINGKDASGENGKDALYVTEFLKGHGNEIVIEPKKSTGAVVRDIEVSSDLQGKDIFFTELWTSERTVVNGSHE